MFKQLKIMLTIGCVLTSTLYVPVQAANLEDSMLKAPAKEETKEESKEASAFSRGTDTVTKAIDLVDLAQEDRIQQIGEMCQKDYQSSGVLASVSAAQCILESGYLTTELATEANNCFGMKAILSGNDWENSSWDGSSIYTKQTGEEYDGQQVVIVADFRSYDSVEDSLADHSAYLLGATVDGGNLRYAGLEGETDYRRAITIIKNGGYATDSSYIDKICSIIEKYDLTRFDELEKKTKKAAKKAKAKDVADSDQLYRVRKSWEDEKSQIGAYKSLENARKVCKDGYKIFDATGTEVE